MNVSYDALRLLRFLLLSKEADNPRCGAEVIKELKLGSGTVYPMLARLKKAAWIRHVASLQAADAPTSNTVTFSIMTAGATCTAVMPSGVLAGVAATSWAFVVTGYPGQGDPRDR